MKVKDFKIGETYVYKHNDENECVFKVIGIKDDNKRTNNIICEDIYLISNNDSCQSEWILQDVYNLDNIYEFNVYDYPEYFI